MLYVQIMLGIIFSSFAWGQKQDGKELGLRAVSCRHHRQAAWKGRSSQIRFITPFTHASYPRRKTTLKAGCILFLTLVWTLLQLPEKLNWQNAV